ncbi:serine/threonine protein kinase [Streptomyces paromomycinus]|uniref:non-specific serine/threonine protein kinase n=1 Tax=Streptomyces paromomycinus TaxID=92743 RepID=A0A401WDG0_STREY|nr:serine/threonine-protein kinase [Streptomyces paromomycinus]GCD47309.1 serine/threonine protein kinase [Streptomyces paromomycinus]
MTGRLLGGRYRVTGQIGRGGMGVVCRAVDEVLGREVAVKVLRAYTDASAPELADLRTRMQREARAAARVRHPGVVTVHDVIDEDGRPVIVMELVDGPSLDDALDRGGPMDPREIAAIGAKVMDALDAAHQVGVLHRDVKPGNVLLERGQRRAGRPDTGVGRVVLTDFGIASIEAPDDGASTHLTRSGELVGSLDYLPPERAQGQPPSPASDIWSLGMTLYAAVEGSGAPFRRTSVWSTLTAIVSEPLPEPRRAGPLTPVLHALMAKDPAARPSAAEARSLLTAVADGRQTVRLGLGTGAGADTGAGTGPGAGTGTDPGTGPGAGTGTDPGTSWSPTAADVRAAPSPAPSPSGGQAPAGPVSGQSPTGPAGGRAPTGPAPAGNLGERETSTVAATGTATPAAGRGRRTCVLATAVAAVLVAGGGVTYGLMARDSGGTVAERRPGAPAQEQEQAARAGASGTPEETGAVEPDGKAPGKDESGRSAAPATSGEPSKSAASGKPKPGGGGDPGKGRSGDGGAAAGGTGGGGDGGAGASGGSASGGGSAAPGGGSATGGTGGVPEPSSCAPIGGGKVNCQVWRAAASYTGSFQHVGTLNAGTNYFYCQANLGRRESYGRWTNTWWARTDDDSGNSGVYVSAVYLKGGRNDAPVPGLPTC